MKEVSLIASFVGEDVALSCNVFKVLLRHYDTDLSRRNTSFVQAKVVRSVVLAEEAAEAAKEAEYKTHLRTRCAISPSLCQS